MGVPEITRAADLPREAKVALLELAGEVPPFGLQLYVLKGRLRKRCQLEISEEAIVEFLSRFYNLEVSIAGHPGTCSSLLGGLADGACNVISGPSGLLKDSYVRGCVGAHPRPPAAPIRAQACRRRPLLFCDPHSLVFRMPCHVTL
jgi:hypothetical protein